MKKTLALSGIAALALIPFGGSVTAQDTDLSRVLDLQVRNDQYAPVDVGEPGLSLGDQDVYSDTLLKDGRQVGTDGGVCTVVRVTGTKAESNCVLSLTLNDGQLTTQGLWSKGSAAHLTVTGGTGAYQGASGELVATNVNTPEEAYRITLR